MEHELLSDLMEDDFYFYKNYILELAGYEYPVELKISKAEAEDEITKTQFETFEHFTKNWNDIQDEMIGALIK